MTSFVETVCTCGEKFCLASETMTALRRSGQGFKCPWGHPLHFSPGPSEADKLRLERDRLKQDAARLQDRIREEREAREAAERRVSAARGQVTRLKNRAANGACPCCNRTFVNLQRHMATKHAGFAKEVQAEAGQTLQ